MRKWQLFISGFVYGLKSIAILLMIALSLSGIIFLGSWIAANLESWIVLSILIFVLPLVFGILNIIPSKKEKKKETLI